MDTTLVLTQGYVPHRIVSWQKAVTMLLYPFTWWTTVDRVMTDTRGGSTRGSERDLLHG